MKRTAEGTLSHTDTVEEDTQTKFSLHTSSSNLFNTTGNGTIQHSLDMRTMDSPVGKPSLNLSVWSSDSAINVGLLFADTLTQAEREEKRVFLVVSTLQRVILAQNHR